jgi:uncharacterized protein YjbJ (UPF0337 family)
LDFSGSFPLIANVSAELLFRKHEVRGTIFGLYWFCEHPRTIGADANGLEPRRRKLEAGEGQGQRAVGKATDDDLDVINGRRDQLEGKIQERYGYAKDQVTRDVDDWYGRQGW